MESFGFGMASFAFWAFVATCVVAGIWSSIREKDARHETLRRIIDSGKDIDADLVDRIMSDGGKSVTDLRVGGLVTMSVAPGLAVLGYVLKVVSGNDAVFKILLGVAGLVFCVAVGLLAAAWVTQRSRTPGNGAPLA